MNPSSLFYVMIMLANVCQKDPDSGQGESRPSSNLGLFSFFPLNCKHFWQNLGLILFFWPLKFLESMIRGSVGLIMYSFTHLPSLMTIILFRYDLNPKRSHYFSPYFVSNASHLLSRAYLLWSIYPWNRKCISITKCSLVSGPGECLNWFISILGAREKDTDRRDNSG